MPSEAFRFEVPLKSRGRREFLATTTLAVLFGRTSYAWSEGVDRDVIAQTEKAIVRGVQWLLNQQADDGGWHSDTYGAMRNGAGTSALALWTLVRHAMSPPSEFAESIRRGIQFLVSRYDEQGFASGVEGISDSPLYATSLLLMAASRANHWASSIDVERLSNALLNSQRTSQTGWTEEQLDFGGWTAFGDQSGTPEGKLPSSISVTAYVLSGLTAHKRLTDAVRSDALTFIERCQNGDGTGNEVGGFRFTPHQDHPLNKAGMVGSQRKSTARSYLSATCDGIRSLQACGLPESDSRFTNATSWISRQQFVFPIASNTTQGSSPIVRGLEFYSASVYGEVFGNLDNRAREPQREAFLRMLIDTQSADGSWTNSNSTMKEDDQLISTSHTLSALIDLSKGE